MPEFYELDINKPAISPAEEEEEPSLPAAKHSSRPSESQFFTSSTTNILLLSLLLCCFFPSLFHSALTTSLRLLAIPLPFLAPLLSPLSSTSARSLVPNSGDIYPAETMSSSWTSKTISLPSRARGSYLITDHIVSSIPEIKDYKVGLLNLFMQHTSAALSLNENWDEDVRADMSDALDRIVPEDHKGDLYRHSCEGKDDMPAHVKSALIGASVTIPIRDGKLMTGTWQGIWHLEFRRAKHTRNVVATIQGDKR